MVFKFLPKVDNCCFWFNLTFGVWFIVVIGGFEGLSYSFIYSFPACRGLYQDAGALRILVMIFAVIVSVLGIFLFVAAVFYGIAVIVNREVFAKPFIIMLVVLPAFVFIHDVVATIRIPVDKVNCNATNIAGSPTLLYAMMSVSNFFWIIIFYYFAVVCNSYNFNVFLPLSPIAQTVLSPHAIALHERDRMMALSRSASPNTPPVPKPNNPNPSNSPGS